MVSVSFGFYFLSSLDSVKWFLANSRLRLFVVSVSSILFLFSLASGIRQVVPDELPASTFGCLRVLRSVSTFFGL